MKFLINLIKSITLTFRPIAFLLTIVLIISLFYNNPKITILYSSIFISILLAFKILTVNPNTL